jgi:hypothetical protein
VQSEHQLNKRGREEREGNVQQHGPRVSLSFVNTESITVGVQDNRCPAAGHVERLHGELHLVTPEMLNGLVEVVHFQHQVRTIARWLQEWLIGYAERVRTDLILDVKLAAVINRSRAREPQDALIKSRVRGRSVAGYMMKANSMILIGEVISGGNMA